MLKEILDNLPHAHLGRRTQTQTRTPPLPPSPALSGTSLNIHHSGCSESAVNAASHSRESLKPTLSSALPPSSLSLTHAYTHTHTLPATATHADRLTCTSARKAQPVPLPDTQTHTRYMNRAARKHTRGDVQ